MLTFQLFQLGFQLSNALPKGKHFISLSDMIAKVSVLVRKLEVIHAIVLAISIFVMNNFLRCQIATQMLFHHEAMFYDISASVGMRMAVSIHKYIAMLVDPATAFPLVRLSRLPLCSMSMQIRYRIAFEVTHFLVGHFGNASRFATAALANTAGDFLWQRRVLAVFVDSLRVQRQKTRRVITMMWLRNYRLSTSTGTKKYVIHTSIVA